MEREQALSELGTSYAVALRLRQRGASHAQIAEVLGIPEAAVDQHLALADAKLERLLDAPAPGRRR